METLQSAAPVGFAFVDRGFRIVRMKGPSLRSAAHQRRSKSAVRSRRWSPDLWSQMGSVYRAVFDTGEPVVNVEVEREGPSQRSPLLAGELLPSRIGKEVIGIGVVVVDITEREKADRLRSCRDGHDGGGPLRTRRRGRLTLHELGSFTDARLERAGIAGKPMHAAIHFQHADGSPHLEADWRC